MWTRIRSATLPLLIVSALIAPSCIFSPEETPPPDKLRVEWPDLTDRDDVAKTIVLCYENPENSESMTRYEALLHSQYFFAFDERDVPPGEPPIMTRADDILSTEWIFDNANLLELALYPEEGGTWAPIAELGGEPCDDCWSGRREYIIRFQTDEEGTIYQSSPGSAAVTIIVAPDEGDPGKWVLRALYDEVVY
jgi:hypothetical protein